MAELILVAVLASDPVRLVVAAVAVLLLRKKGPVSILWAAVVAAVAAETLMAALGSGPWGRTIVAGLVVGLLHSGVVYGVLRLFRGKPAPQE